MAAHSCRFRPAPPASGVALIGDIVPLGCEEGEDLEVPRENIAAWRGDARLNAGHSGRAHAYGIGDDALAEPYPSSQRTPPRWLRQRSATSVLAECVVESIFFHLYSDR